MKQVSVPKGRVVLYFPILYAQWPMWSPLCMFALAAALMAEGYEVTLIDERVDEDPRGWLEKELPGALLVGIPSKLGGQCRNMESTAEFIKAKNRDVAVVAGGWFPSLFPEQTMTSENIDIIVIGPGDFALPEVANRLLEGRSLDGIENVFFKRNGKIVKNQVNHLPSLEKTVPIPWEIVGIKRYLHPHGWINYFSSRGCPGGCVFCSIHCLDPRRWTALSPERVIEDLETLVHKIGARAFQITDADFCASLKRVEGICRLIQERGLQIRFHVLGRYQTLVRMSDEQVRLLRQSGCTEIEVGLESGSQSVADSINKQVDVERFVETARRFSAAGIRMRVNVMLGIPGETRKDLVSTFRKMLELRELGDGIRFQMFRFTPLPDSEIGKKVLSVSANGRAHRVPTTYRELLEFPVIDEETEMYWIDAKHERDVKRSYSFYAPLLFYKVALDSAEGRPWWRFALKCFIPLARWRVARARFAFPFELWLNRAFGRRMPLGTDAGIPHPEDQLPVPEMGQAFDDLPPLEPSLSSKDMRGR
ncbi:MAG: radical SAM protein [Planctomycetota bacterium]